MPKANPPTTQAAATVRVDANGRIAANGKLPIDIVKEILPNGKIRYSIIVFDNGEKVVANADF